MQSWYVGAIKRRGVYALGVLGALASGLGCSPKLIGNFQITNGTSTTTVTVDCAHPSASLPFSGGGSGTAGSPYQI